MDKIKQFVTTYSLHIILVVITAVIAFQGAYILSLQAQIKLNERVTAGEVMDYNQNVNIQQINAFINNAVKNAQSSQETGNTNPSDTATRPASTDTK